MSFYGLIDQTGNVRVTKTIELFTPGVNQSSPGAALYTKTTNTLGEVDWDVSPVVPQGMYDVRITDSGAEPTTKWETNVPVIKTLSFGVSDHTLLSNLAWTSSGHTGTASRLAAFNGAGVTSYIDYSTDWLTQYHNDSRALTWLGTRSTTDLPEGTNLYYTQTRFDTAFSAKSTTNLSEGTNLYYTDERVDDRVAALIQNGTALTWTYDDTANTLTGNVVVGSLDHGGLAGLTDDDHVGYARLAGRAGGQTLYGDTASGGNLTVGSTAHATKGKIYFGNNSVYREDLGIWGFGTTTPDTRMQVEINRISTTNSYQAGLLVHHTVNINTATVEMVGALYQTTTSDGGAALTLIGMDCLAEDSGANTTGVVIGMRGDAQGGLVNWAGYFNNGNVKIVNNLVTGGFTMNVAATTGYVLTTDANGEGTWQAPPAGYTDEQAQDAVGGMLVDSATIDLTYTDGTPSITADVRVDSINDTHLDWGSGANQIDASDLPMLRVGASTYSTVQDMQNIFHSAGWASGGVMSDAGGGTINVTAGTGLIRTSASATAADLWFDWSASNGLAITTDTIRYIGVEYNVGSPQVVVRTTENWNYFTDFPLGNVVNEGGALQILNAPHAVGDHASMMIQEMIGTMKFERHDSTGLIVGETGTRNLTVTEGAMWYGLTKLTVSAVDTSVSDTFDLYYRDGVGGWTKVASQTQWPNTQYDDGSGTLATMTAARYANLWLYLESDGDLVVLYGQNQYTTSAQASEGTPPATVPNRIMSHGRLIARLTFQKSDATAEEIVSAFMQNFGATGVTDHGGLAGLTDDDHTQYALLAGRATGQTLIGGTAASEILTLQSTAHVTRGSIRVIDSLIGGTGSDYTFNPDVANGGSAVAYTFDTLNTLTTTAKIASFKNNGTEVLSVEDNGDLTCKNWFYFGGAGAEMRLAAGSGLIYLQTAAGGNPRIYAAGGAFLGNAALGYYTGTVVDFQPNTVLSWAAVSIGAGQDAGLKRGGISTLQITDGSTGYGDLTVLDEVYGVGWNGSQEVPTKNAVYDKIQTYSNVENTALSTWAGSTNLTTLGTVSTGVWEGTVVDVAHGGTGVASLTAYAVLCGGTTTTGDVQSVAGLGSSGQVLTSNGASALPTFQTAAAGATVVRTTGDVTEGDGNLTDITGLSFSIGASEVWVFNATLFTDLDNTAGAMETAVNVPASATLKVIVLSATTGPTALIQEVLTTDDGATTNLSQSYTSEGAIHMSGTVVNSTNAGTVQIRFKVTNAAYLATVYANSFLIAYKIA